MKADQLSQTAAFLAIKFYGLTRLPPFQKLFDDSIITFYERLVQSLPAPNRYYHFWLKFSWVRKLYMWSEELLLPGDLLHVIARKWYIQQQAEQYLGQGYKQFIVLGAGFDHLAYHFCQQNITCLECDVPYMAGLKREFLKEHYPTNPHPHIADTYLPEDELLKIFSRQPIDPHKKTVIVAEGFFDYLASGTVSDSLKQIQQYFSEDPALISTHFALDELSFLQRNVFQSSIQLVGEKLELENSIKEFRTLLNGSGFKIQRKITSQDIEQQLQKLTDTSLPMLKGFYILNAQ